MGVSDSDRLLVRRPGGGGLGDLFFSPFFMLVVGLSPAQAIGAGLLTEVAGMGNGLRAYVKQCVVDYATAKWLLAGSIPAIVVGALLAHRVDPTVLKLAFGAGLLVLGGFLVFYPSPEDCEPGEKAGPEDETGAETVIEAADGETFRYRTCWRAPGVGLASVGGFVTGLISA
ncbi:sulfite exporter TauE/SafE family protein, partial [Natronomonas sp.]|uniref:sulfite exporter TauE/SafE family protein n=1 Tax=Natronomonas sp. TaxID=2184060 RepID=UPI002FC279C5